MKGCPNKKCQYYYEDPFAEQDYYCEWIVKPGNIGKSAIEEGDFNYNMGEFGKHCKSCAYYKEYKKELVRELIEEIDKL